MVSNFNQNPLMFGKSSSTTKVTKGKPQDTDYKIFIQNPKLSADFGSVVNKVRPKSELNQRSHVSVCLF